MSDIKKLINEYASLTGRPVATISISEYIELKKYSEEDRLLLPVNKDVSKEAVCEEESVKEMTYEPETEEIIKTADEIDSNKNAPITSPLMLMRSIKG